jgi:hypothetical protein
MGSRLIRHARIAKDVREISAVRNALRLGYDGGGMREFKRDVIGVDLGAHRKKGGLVPLVSRVCERRLTAWSRSSVPFTAEVRTFSIK